MVLIMSFSQKKYKNIIIQIEGNTGFLTLDRQSCNNALDIETSKDLKILSDHKGLISSFNDKNNNIFNYRLVFKNRDELIKFKNELIKNEGVNNIRSDLQS